MTVPRNTNIDNSVISEVYDLLNGSNQHILKTNQNYQLLKPSQNSELKEIRFRSFDPIMKKSLSTLTQRSAEISIEPRIFKTTRGQSHTIINKNYEKFVLSPPIKLSDHSTYHTQILNYMAYVPEETPDNKKFNKDNQIFIIRCIEEDNIPYDLCNVTYCITFTDTAKAAAIRHFGASTFEYITIQQQNIYDFTAQGHVTSGGCFWFYFVHEGTSYSNQFWLEIHYSSDNTDKHPHMGKVWNPDNENKVRFPAYIEHHTYINGGSPSWEKQQKLSYSKTFYYDTELLKNYNPQKINLYTYANQTYLPIKSDTVKTNLIGDVNELIDNINEKIAGYCSNFKPSSTMRLIDNTNDDLSEWFLTSYIEDPKNDLTVDQYYNNYNAQNKLRRSVNPTKYFTKFYVKKENDDEYIFGTTNLLFNFRKYPNPVDPCINYDMFWVSFNVNIRCDVDIFNVGMDRQYHNNLENVIEKNYLDIKAVKNLENQCISTNNDTVLNLIYANYLAHGLDIVLKSQEISNLTNTVFVNKCVSEVYMKISQQFSTQNYITVYLTDINNNPINEDYLKKLYKSILVEIDFVYN